MPSLHFQILVLVRSLRRISRRGGSAFAVVLMVLLLLASTKDVWATSHEQFILRSAYWEDTGGQASLEQAQRQALIPYQGILNRGYTDSVHWIRLTLAASTAPIGLQISPSWLDEITLYDPALPGRHLTAGDRHPVGISASQELGYTFELPAASAQRDVWLKLRSTSAHQLVAEAMPTDQLQVIKTRAIVWVALYTALLLISLLVLIGVWFFQRDRVLGAYLARHAMFMCYGMGFLGLPGTLLSNIPVPPGFWDITFSLSAVTTLSLGLWFDIALLSTYNPNRYLLRLLKILAWLSPGLAVLLLSGYQRQALQLNAQAVLLASLLVFISAWSTSPDPSVERLVPKKVIFSYYALVAVSLLIGLFGVMGWSQPQGWTRYLLVLHGLVSLLLMTVILLVRGHRQFQHNQQINWKLQKAQQDMELEQRRRHEQSQFLHMLMHELKTPLAVISLALGTKNNREANLEHAGRAVQDMKAIIDRCVQADQMGQLTLTQHNQAVDLPALIRQLGHKIPMLESRLQFNVPCDLPSLHTDQQLLQIILNNLLDNAARYSDPVTPVIVTLRGVSLRGNPGLVVRVGNIPGLAGWPDEQQLFSKYYRSSGAQRESGSGLGLYLARQLANSLGGSLDYTPSAQHVEFVLWIPLSLD